MNFYQISKLGSGSSKGCTERLPHFECFTELRTNEFDQVWFARNEAVVGVDVTPRGSRIVAQARGKAAGRCAAKGPEIYYRTFARVDISRQLVEQLALFKAEQAQGIASSLRIWIKPWFGIYHQGSLLKSQNEIRELGVF